MRSSSRHYMAPATHPAMRKPRALLLLSLQWLLLLALLPPPINADVGTAAHYGPPYLPTVCHGGDTGQFPEDNLFVAAGEGIWDNGASCGREYLVRCLSSATPGACIDGAGEVQVVVVDQAASLNSQPSKNGTTMVLSAYAFQLIANSSAVDVNIEFTQI